MIEIAKLQLLRDGRFFANWDGFVSPERIAASEASLRQLVDDLIALGPEMSEKDARAAVNACVLRFNELDGSEDGPWIFTIEREDIYERMGEVIDLCGFDYDEDWDSERDW